MENFTYQGLNMMCLCTSRTVVVQSVVHKKQKQGNKELHSKKIDVYILYTQLFYHHNNTVVTFILKQGFKKKMRSIFFFFCLLKLFLLTFDGHDFTFDAILRTFYT